MSAYTFYKLPINPDEGFPQSFQLNFQRQVYRFSLYANVLVDVGDVPPEHLYHLPEEGAYLVLQIARQSAAGLQVIFQRKLVQGLECPAAELVILFKEMTLSKRNLNGAGAFGSVITGGVAARWA